MDNKGAIQHILDRLEQELPEHLTYHGHHHTLDVMEATERIAKAEGISGELLNLLLVASAYHDSGFLYDHREHEKRGCEIAKDVLPEFGFSEEQIEAVCKMIMATKVPQDPKNELSKILCDADLDYLGRDDFEQIGSTLFKELQALGVVETVETWNRIQLGFLQQHSYHTEYGRKYRQQPKQQHLEKIRSIVAGYDQ
ncbi:MAG: HD domain-containing protein [Flavobacteriales bacterium]|nr:HD domain-containing protein [Flavobacteriales bacterium]